MYNYVESYFRQVYAADDQAFLALMGFLGVSVLISFYFSLYFFYNGFFWLRGKLSMRKKRRVRQEICDAFEEVIVDSLTDMLNNNQLTIEEARQLYAKLGHLGFWGLHPRKFVPKTSKEDLQDLKERLKAERQLRTKRDQGIDVLLDSLAAELG